MSTDYCVENVMLLICVSVAVVCSDVCASGAYDVWSEYDISLILSCVST